MIVEVSSFAQDSTASGVLTLVSTTSVWLQNNSFYLSAWHKTLH